MGNKSVAVSSGGFRAASEALLLKIQLIAPAAAAAAWMLCYGASVSNKQHWMKLNSGAAVTSWFTGCNQSPDDCSAAALDTTTGRHWINTVSDHNIRPLTLQETTCGKNNGWRSEDTKNIKDSGSDGAYSYKCPNIGHIALHSVIWTSISKPSRHFDTDKPVKAKSIIKQVEKH